MIVVEKLYKVLGGKPILKNLSFHVEQGSIFGIVGPSGAGKSTLFRCLSGLLLPTHGHIQGNTGLGIVFQHFPLLTSRTALENVELPLIIKGVDKSFARIALRQVGIESLSNCYPATLSGGQKQRVAIARALAARPSILLLDEPTSALDPQSTKELQELLRKLNKGGLTIILITHEMDLVRSLASSIAVMDQGEIVEMGPIAHVFGSPSHPVTKALLEEMHHPLPEDLAENCLRLHFRGTTTKEPIISRLIKEHDVEINILKGAIDQIQNETMGELLISLQGPDREKAIAFLEEKGVNVERLTC